MRKMKRMSELENYKHFKYKFKPIALSGLQISEDNPVMYTYYDLVKEWHKNGGTYEFYLLGNLIILDQRKSVGSNYAVFEAVLV